MDGLVDSDSCSNVVDGIGASDAVDVLLETLESLTDIPKVL